MKKYLLILIVFFSFNFSSYSQGSNPAEYNYEIQFIKTGLQGTELFKVFTYCKKEIDCIEYAKADAVKAILFKGIPGSGMAQPMVNEIGAEEKYKAYFTEFFKSDGKYLNYVSISNDGSINENDRFKVGKHLKIGVIVSVQKANLRKELEAAGIIKKLDNGF